MRPGQLTAANRSANPVAFFPKTGIDAYSPLATVIIGGLTISTVLTLFVVPVLYSTFDDLSICVKSRRARSNVPNPGEPVRA
jgi:Cu/Ag efflux pump CusA